MLLYKKFIDTEGSCKFSVPGLEVALIINRLRKNSKLKTQNSLLVTQNTKLKKILRGHFKIGV